MFSNLLSKVIKGKTLLEHSCQRHYLSITLSKGAQDSKEKCQHSALLSWQKQWTQLKKIGEWIHYAMPFLEKREREKKKSNNNNGTQGNNKITTTKKDRKQESKHAVSAGKLQVEQKVILKFTKCTMKPTKRLCLTVKLSLVFYFFPCFIFLFFSTFSSADSLCLIW